MTTSKAKRLYVIPRTPETVVRDPRTRVKLPPEGMYVADTSYWRRRLKDEDVAKTTDEAIAKGKAERLAKEKAAQAASSPAPAAADAKSDTKKAKE